MKQNNTYAIYIHTNLINNKVYIGQTSHGENPNLRWGTNGNGYKDQPEFYQDIQKYGWNNFTHNILENGLTSIEADIKEKKYITIYNSTNPDKGYNKSIGRKLPDRKCQKIGMKNRQNAPKQLLNK